MEHFGPKLGVDWLGTAHQEDTDVFLFEFFGELVDLFGDKIHEIVDLFGGPVPVFGTKEEKRNEFNFGGFEGIDDDLDTIEAATVTFEAR